MGMTRFAGSYSLGRPTRKCATTGRELLVGEVYVATLSEVPGNETPVRVDYSLEGWTSVTEARGTKRPRGVMAFWRTHVNDPAKKTETKILDDDALTDLFEQTETPDAPDLSAEPDATDAGGQPAQSAVSIDAKQRRLALRFVLALLMLRRKLLILETTRPGLMLVRHKGVPRPPEGPALIEVIDPGVDEATIVSVISELEGDTNTPSTTATANSAGTPAVTGV
ncbi:MAG: hypothetical protein IBJ18_04355 [Phycisphaerales bacterium]|nr:hypothetical protein [Phycisphaerales bacterium]